MAQEQKSTRRKEQKAPENTSCPRAAQPIRRGVGQQKQKSVEGDTAMKWKEIQQ